MIYLTKLSLSKLTVRIGILSQKRQSMMQCLSVGMLTYGTRKCGQEGSKLVATQSPPPARDGTVAD